MDYLLEDRVTGEGETIYYRSLGELLTRKGSTEYLLRSERYHSGTAMPSHQTYLL